MLFGKKRPSIRLRQNIRPNCQIFGFGRLPKNIWHTPIGYAFIQSLVTKCLVPFSKCILHYKNILTTQYVVWKRSVQWIILIIVVNPLWTEFFFSSFFGTWPKIGSFRLPTHWRDAHRKFFWWSLLKIELKFWWKGPPVSSWALKG